MPGFVIGSTASVVGEAWVGAPDSAPSGATLSPPAIPSGVTLPTQRVAFVYKPSAFGPSAVTAVPSVKRNAKPAAWSNAPVVQTPRMTLVLTGAAFSNSSSFPAVSLKRAQRPAIFANSPTFFSARLTLRISTAAYANTGQVYTVTVSQGASTKAAPHRVSGVAIFAPAIVRPATTSVTVTLSLPGVIPRAPQAPLCRAKAAWPNLPKADAPPWRLTVVTPELARERARAQIAWRKRAERERRKRRADERTDAIVRTLIDDEVVRTVAAVLAER